MRRRDHTIATLADAHRTPHTDGAPAMNSRGFAPTARLADVQPIFSTELPQ